MDTGIILKMVKVSLKERYTRGGLLIALLALGFSMFFLSLSYLIGLSHLHVASIALPKEYVLYISILLTFYLLPSISMFSKAEADFVLTAPVDPVDVMISKILVAAITDVAIMVAMTYWYPMVLAIIGQTYVVPEYLIEVALFGFTLSAFSLLLSLGKGRTMILGIAIYVAYAVITSMLCPQLNVIYMIMKPNGYYLLSFLVLLLFSMGFLRRSINSIYVNIYSLTLSGPSRPSRRGVAGPFPSSMSFAGLGPALAMLKSSLFSASLQFRMNAGASSSYRLQRVNALALGLPISAVSAAIYSLLMLNMGLQGSSFFVWFPAFYMGIFAFSLALSGLGGERLWLSCMAMDCTTYFKTRMYVRSVAGLLLSLPWILAYIAMFALSGSFLSLLTAISLASIMPSIASLSLMIAPWTGIRQNKFVGLEEYVPRVNPLGFLIGIIAMIITAMYMIAPLLYVAYPSKPLALAVSIVFLVLSLSMPSILGSQGMVRKLVDKLIAEGFI